MAAHPSPQDDIPNARIANYWHCLPEYAQARKAIWTAINPHTGKLRIDEAFPHAIRAGTRNDDMSITFKSGASWRVVGSDNPNSLVGATPFGIVFSEWQLSNPSSWGYLQPMVLENGGWADFIFTSRGKNHAYKMHESAKGNPNWFRQTLTIDDTGQLSAEQLAEAKKDYISIYGEDAAEALMQQEYWCSFEAAILGAYYAREMAAAQVEGRIGSFKPWPNCPINTAWDLGVSRGSNTMAVWDWQIVPTTSGKSAIQILHYDTGSGYGIPYFAKRAHERREKWQAELQVEFPDATLPQGVDYVPHDARTPEMSSSGHDGKAKQRIEVMREQKMNPKIVQNHHVADGISAVRQVFWRFRFDEEGCGVGVDAMREYQAEWDDDLKKFKDIPLGNWAAHPADGIRYLAMAYREVAAPPAPVDPRALVVGGENALPLGMKGVTLEDMWRAKRTTRRRI